MGYGPGAGGPMIGGGLDQHGQPFPSSHAPMAPMQQPPPYDMKPDQVADLDVKAGQMPGLTYKMHS